VSTTLPAPFLRSFRKRAWHALEKKKGNIGHHNPRWGGVELKSTGKRYQLYYPDGIQRKILCMARITKILRNEGRPATNKKGGSDEGGDRFCEKGSDPGVGEGDVRQGQFLNHTIKPSLLGKTSPHEAAVALPRKERKKRFQNEWTGKTGNMPETSRIDLESGSDGLQFKEKKYRPSYGEFNQQTYWLLKKLKVH